MKIRNVHERQLNAPQELVGALLDTLSSKDDRLWPSDRWPPMRFNAPLGVGASGGHGPVHYAVSAYVPGRITEFQFDGTGLTAGLDGRHLFEVIPHRSFVTLRHTIDAACDIKTWLTWHFVIGPMHDALLEDALDGAERHLNPGSSQSSRWSLWVRFLRRMTAKRASRITGKSA